MNWVKGLMVGLVTVAAASAQAGVVYTYGWEDGNTILGSFGNVVDPTNVTGVQNGLLNSGGDPYSCPGAAEGDYYLHVAEEPHASTPQAYIAFITGLEPGDMVTASFAGYDTTPAASPSLRIWGHWADSSDINIYSGSAGGNDTYTDGNGWGTVSHTWTIDGTDDALVIEARLYSISATANPARTDYWIDDLMIDVTSQDGVYGVTTPGYTITVPEPASLALLGLGGLFLRRRR